MRRYELNYDVGENVAIKGKIKDIKITEGKTVLYGVDISTTRLSQIAYCYAEALRRPEMQDTDYCQSCKYAVDRWAMIAGCKDAKCVSCRHNYFSQYKQREEQIV